MNSQTDHLDTALAGRPGIKRLTGAAATATLRDNLNPNVAGE